MTQIHPTAVVESGAELAHDVRVGPFCVVGADVILASGVSLHSHVVVMGHTEIGAGTEVYPFASLGTPPQHLKYRGEPSRLVIGENNVIREQVTMNPGTAIGRMLTEVGDDGLYMVGVHIAHDCRVGDHVVMANCATLAGHVTVGDHVMLGGLSAVKQYTRIGAHAMIGGKAGIARDVIPYGSVTAPGSRLHGLNLIGLRRRKMARQVIEDLRTAYRLLFAEEGTMAERMADVERMFGGNEAVCEIMEFIRSTEGELRTICWPYRIGDRESG